MKWVKRQLGKKFNLQFTHQERIYRYFRGILENSTVGISKIASAMANSSAPASFIATSRLIEHAAGCKVTILNAQICF